MCRHLQLIRMGIWQHTHTVTTTDITPYIDATMMWLLWP